jgi:two-component system NarL family sensor kinase
MQSSQITAKRNAHLRTRIFWILLASLPLLISIGWVRWTLPGVIADTTANVVKAVNVIVFQARKDELKHFVQAGSKVMAHYCATENGVITLSHEGKELLRHMDFGDLTDDNYFFIYDMKGFNVMHPRLPEIEGKDLSGNKVIQALLAASQATDHYVEYDWNRPSTGQVESKIGYVEYVPECKLMIGTGLYLDYLKEIAIVIQKATTEKIELERDRIVIIVLASLLVVAAGGMTLNIRQQTVANKEIRRMAERIMQAQEEERTRVSRELHDGVCQWLAAAKFTVETAHLQLARGNAEKCDRTLTLGIENIRKIIDDVREISHGLIPPELTDGLGPTIEQACRGFGERTGIAMSVQIGKIPVLNQWVSNALFRTFQEATQNVERHARATRVNVIVESDKKGIWMRITDNGRGMVNRTPGHHGIGLINMRERIENQGGEFEFLPTPGATTITAFIPINTL